MLRRVRKIEDNHILLLNYSNFVVSIEATASSYDEMKQVLLEMKDINLQREYERNGNTTRIKYVLDSYDENYIYNKVEEKNAQREVFLKTFLAMAESKGFQYEFLSYGEKESTNGNQEHRINRKVHEVLAAPDITPEEADLLRQKTNRLEDNKDDRLKLDRHFIKLQLGLDTLDEHVLTAYQYKTHTIRNFTALIDEQNIPQEDDNNYDELLFKVPVVRELLQKLGYSGMFDYTNSRSKDQLAQSIKDMTGNNIFTNNKTYHKAFESTSKKLKDCNTLRKQLNYVNECLDEFNLKVELQRSGYKLTQLRNVAEIVEYGAYKGRKLFDTNGSFQKTST
jgi:hypothetical protein